jgi:hypothetical protein
VNGGDRRRIFATNVVFHVRLFDQDSQAVTTL